MFRNTFFTKRTYYTTLLLFTYLGTVLCGFCITYSNAQTNEVITDAKILPTIATAELYDFKGVKLDTSNTYGGLLRFEKSSIDWYSSDPNQRIIKMGELKNKDSVTFWYRVPLKMSYNVYTIATRTDVVQQALGSDFSTRIGRIYTRSNCADDWHGPTEYKINIPYYDINTAGGNPGTDSGVGDGDTQTQTEISAAKAYFVSKCLYDGTFNMRIKLTPELGMPTSIEDGKWVSNYTAMRLSTAKTVNNGDPTNLVYGLIANQGRTYVGYNINDDKLQTGTSSTPSATGQTLPTSKGDCKTGFSGNGVKSVTINPVAGYGEDIMPSSKGASIDLINKITGQKLIDISANAPVENMTDWLLPIPIKLQPSFSIFSTTWSVKEVKAGVDTVDEYGALGDAGVRYADWSTKEYVTVNGWRVDNVYIHQEIAFSVDVAVKYNLIAEDEDIEGGLENPEMQIGDDVFDAFVSGTTEYGTEFTGDTAWANFLAYLPYIIAIAVVIVVFFLARAYIPKGGSSGSTKINIQQSQESKTEKSGKVDASIYKVKEDDTYRMEKQFEQLNYRLDKLLDENARLRAEKEDLEKIARGMGS